LRTFSTFGIPKLKAYAMFYQELKARGSGEIL